MSDLLGLGARGVCRDLRKLVLAKLDCWDMELVKHAHIPQSTTVVFHDRAFHSWCARNGHLGLLQWIELHVFQCTEVCAEAAVGGHLHVLQWLVHMGCPMRYPLYPHAAVSGNVEMLEWLKIREHSRIPIGKERPDACNIAVKYGHLPALQWLDKNGFYMLDHLHDIAIQNDHLHVLQWLVAAKGYSLHPANALVAAHGGHLHILQWLHSIGQMSPSVCAVAADQGHLDALRWLVENGYPIDIDECMASDAYKFHWNGCERRPYIVAYLESLRAH
jgi:hypothetical protein